MPATDHSVPVAEERLGAALREIILHPWRNLVGLWNWKSAALSMLIRAVTFLLSNLRAGGHKAVQAMLAEAAFAIFAAGIMGAITQRLRLAKPQSATALILCFAMPGCMVAIQSGWHHAAGTPHLRTGLIVSFCFAAIASGFTWFTMQRGAMLAGEENVGIRADICAMPAILLDFLLFAPRAVVRRCKQA